MCFIDCPVLRPRKVQYVYSCILYAYLDIHNNKFSVAQSSGASPVDLVTSSREVKDMITILEKNFDDLKDTIIERLEKHKVLVRKVADVLTTLSLDADDRHKLFLEQRCRILITAVHHSEIFAILNFHWNYLDPSLLEHLVRKLSLDEVKVLMDKYKSDLHQFRMKTPVFLFCRAHKRKSIEPVPEFQEVVAKFNWTDQVTMEAVEKFRQEYVSYYGLYECAMLITQVHSGSFIVYFLIPDSIVQLLRENLPVAVFKDYSVTKLVIAGASVYPEEVFCAIICPIICKQVS